MELITNHTVLAILLDMGLPENREQEHYTYSQYLTWPEGERYELIDGIAYAMSPAPISKLLSSTSKVEVCNPLVMPCCVLRVPRR